MKDITQVGLASQAEQTLVHREVVESAPLPHNFYRGPRPGRRLAPTESELSTRDRVTLLCGQLRLLRLRAEMGMFVSPDSIARAERLASSLEAAA
jgi:hypothetical protein